MVPMFLLGKSVSNDFEDLRESVAEVPSHGAGIIMFTCVAGLMIGYASASLYGTALRGLHLASPDTLGGCVEA